MLKDKSELLMADIEYRTVVAMQRDDPNAPDHQPNAYEIAGSMIRVHGDDATARWLECPDTLRERYPQVLALLEHALNPATYDR